MSWKEVGMRRMLLDWTQDPVRRRHVAFRVVETLVPAFLVLWWQVGWLRAVGCAAGLALLEWALYEFVLEPFFPRWTGPYWERGPQPNETFVRW